MKDWFSKDSHSIFNKLSKAFETTIEVIDKIDEEDNSDDINDSLINIIGKIFSEEDHITNTYLFLILLNNLEEIFNSSFKIERKFLLSLTMYFSNIIKNLQCINIITKFLYFYD